MVPTESLSTRLMWLHLILCTEVGTTIWQGSIKFEQRSNNYITLWWIYITALLATCIRLHLMFLVHRRWWPNITTVSLSWRVPVSLFSWSILHSKSSPITLYIHAHTFFYLLHCFITQQIKITEFDKQAFRIKAEGWGYMHKHLAKPLYNYWLCIVHFQVWRDIWPPKTPTGRIHATSIQSQECKLGNQWVKYQRLQECRLFIL